MRLVMDNLTFVISILKLILPKYLKTIIIKQNEITVTIHNKHVYNCLLFLKNNSLLNFDLLSDIYVTDYPDKNNRFVICYTLYSIKHNLRLFIKTSLKIEESVMSVSALFKSANWLERECWDLFGIFFTNHADLRRILTDYGFNGFPLRKDFPLTGYIELRYDDERNSIVYEPLELTQEFRNFETLTPWESIK